MSNKDEQARRNPEEYKAPNPLWPLLAAVIIIIIVIIIIFMVVSPALA